MTNTDIKGAVHKIVVKMCAENARHEKALKKLNQDLAKIQRDCPHDKTSYEPDPSGNNDSTTTCLICDKSARRL